MQQRIKRPELDEDNLTDRDIKFVRLRDISNTLDDILHQLVLLNSSIVLAHGEQPAYTITSSSGTEGIDLRKGG